MKKLLKFCFNTSAWNPSRLEWLQVLSAVTKEERERIDKYFFKQDAKQALVSHLLIRYSLKSLLGIEWNQIVLARTSNGKPYLKLKETIHNYQKSSPSSTQSSSISSSSSSSSSSAINLSNDLVVDFNASHAGDYAIVAAGAASFNSSKSYEHNQESFGIGVDVMKVDVDRKKSSTSSSTNNATAASNSNSSNNEEEELITDAMLYRQKLASHERVMNSKFSDIEKNYIRNRVSDVERLTAFYRLWSLKESYVKAVGEGLGFDIKRLEFLVTSDLYIDLIGRRHLVANDTQLFIDTKPAKNTQFYEQYYTNMNTNNTQQQQQQQQSGHDGQQQQQSRNLHIMTLCIIEKEKEKEKEKESGNSSGNTTIGNNGGGGGGNECNEFVELTFKDLKEAFVAIEKVDNSNMEDFEEFWLSFKNKTERPFS